MFLVNSSETCTPRCHTLASFIIRFFRMALFGVLTVSCGLSSPLYKAYSSDSTNTETCEPSLTLFKSNIEPAVISTCATAGCHGAATKIRGYYLSTEDSEQTMRAFRAFGLRNLYDKYSSTTPHGGGALGSAIPEDILNEWIDADDACPE